MRSKCSLGTLRGGVNQCGYVSSSAFAVLNTVDPLIEGDPIAIVVCAPYLCMSFDLMNLY